MDVSSFLIGSLPLLAVGIVCVIAFRRRRRSTFPLIMNPYTMIVEPDAAALGKLPLVQPLPPTTTSQDLDPLRPRAGLDTSRTRLADGPDQHRSSAATAPPRNL